jgi:hypothetical protein
MKVKREPKTGFDSKGLTVRWQKKMFAMQTAKTLLVEDLCVQRSGMIIIMIESISRQFLFLVMRNLRVEVMRIHHV